MTAKEADDKRCVSPHGKDDSSPLKSWVDSFAGKWQDSRSAEDIIKDIYDARTFNPLTNNRNTSPMKVKIINRSRHALPAYATPLSAGMDLRANLDAPITLAPLERTLIPTGLQIGLPAGYEAQVRPRSGLALKHGISILNSPGTIDADYRGEIGIIIANLSAEPFTIADGDRIAQLVVARHETVEWEPCEALSETERGDGGFGHTGC